MIVRRNLRSVPEISETPAWENIYPYRIAPPPFHFFPSPNIRMYSVLYIDFLLPWEKSVFGGIAYCEKTGKLVAFGGIDRFLYAVGLVAHGDVEHRAPSLRLRPQAAYSPPRTTTNSSWRRWSFVGALNAAPITFRRISSLTSRPEISIAPPIGFRRFLIDCRFCAANAHTFEGNLLTRALP